MNIEYINYAQVREGIEQLKQCATTMEDIFNTVTGSMKTLTNEEVFKGKASTALAAEFEPFRGRFVNYVSIVRDFAALFSEASTTLEDTENRLKQEAEATGE